LSPSESSRVDRRGSRSSKWPCHVRCTISRPDAPASTSFFAARWFLVGHHAPSIGREYAGVPLEVLEMTAMHLGGGFDFSASYDALDRATDLKTKRTSDGTTLFDQARTFDAAGNVLTASTTLGAATDNQVFCYDEQNRLTWAGSAGVPPCTGTAITAGSLSAAQYSQSFSYDNMGQLTSGPLGTYGYGDPAHVHAATTWHASLEIALRAAPPPVPGALHPTPGSRYPSARRRPDAAAARSSAGG
jgi:hypothetical protein